MPGKRDQASHDAAIAKIAGALPHSDIIRAHLGEILDNAAFKGSHRSREFLTHVVECALCGQWERLKERSLGIDVFSRDPSYDTGVDSIVRVTASDVRKRLLQYYSECRGPHAFRIEIPTGSYIPEFPGLRELTGAVARGEAAGGPRNGMSGTLSIDSRSASQRRARKAALALVAVCVGWVFGLISARYMSGISVKADSRYEFYRELLGPIASDLAHETEIALSNPRLLVYVGSNDPATPPWPSTVNARVSSEFEKMLNPSANDMQAKYPFHFLTLADQDYTEIGEAISAFNLSQLLRSLGRSPRLTESRFLNWRAMRNVHVILLGAPQMSAWAQESLERSNFTMERDAITNARPLSGERRTYHRSVDGSTLEDYGLIWMARSPSGSRQLLMAGLTSAGTGSVSDFFCDPDRMRPVYEQLRAASKNGSIVSEWQVLLHIHARENVPLQVNFVSLRAGGINR
ncbi:MAG: hypothetical protein WA324_22145 [Bryobacteraceae bacterium]